VLRTILPGIFQIDLPWTNAWLLAADGNAVLIDTGTRWDRAAILRAMGEAMPGGFRLRSILLTHAHCDHAGNAAWLAERFGAEIRCHAKERPYVATRRTYIPRGFRAAGVSGFLFLGGELIFPVRRREPECLLKEGDAVDTPVGPLTVIETSGHTPGHVSYYHEREGWLFSGDALINVIPWIRREGLSLPVRVFTSDPVAAAESAWRISDLDASGLFPGHGPPLMDDAASRIRAFLEKAAPQSRGAGLRKAGRK
jgi:glyoxylase-like metal-dependent hydrolase (beta-lactamase superfamily II)